jgi:hypothetical protein
VTKTKTIQVPSLKVTVPLAAILHELRFSCGGREGQGSHDPLATGQIHRLLT